tara:strand:- start:442 stop:795 length:354 start_codon:yes stop_codon:yes gene_type:complete
MEELKTKIIGLKEQIQILDNDRQELQNHLATVEKDYTESTLPVITDDFYELIESSIRKAVNDIAFSDEESYEICYEVNYKELSVDIDLNRDIREELISLVLEGVTSLFKLEETENGN